MKGNLFDGESMKAVFARCAYELLKDGGWVTYADVMERAQNGRPLKCTVSKADNYGELKKAFPEVIEALGKENVVSDGNNRCRRYRYVGTDKNPLGDMINTKAINDIRRYWEFCQESEGFMPTSWLEYFLKDSRDLLRIKDQRKSGERVMSTGIDRKLDNIDLLPFFYDAIKHRTVLELTFRPEYEKPLTLTFHPHYLREYNGRWFVLGHADGKEPMFGFNIAIDRIDKESLHPADGKFISAPAHFYDDYFSDIVGVTHFAGAEAVDIRIRAHDHYMFMLTKTKPIHASQTIVKEFGKHDDGEYGEFQVCVAMNNEFVGRIMQMGAGLEVVSPADVRNRFREIAAKMLDRYSRE